MYLLHRKLLYIWESLGLPDETVVSIVLALSMLGMMTFIVLYLGVEAVIEGVQAVLAGSTWVREYIKDEATQNKFQDVLHVRSTIPSHLLPTIYRLLIEAVSLKIYRISTDLRKIRM